MGRNDFDHEYPPARWTAEGLADALRDGGGADPLPAYDDAAFFEAVADADLTAPAVDRVLSDAVDAAGEPVPTLPASSYLEYDRSGDRSGYEERVNERFSRLSLFALAECFDREGRHLDAVLDHAWAVCEQSTWLLPAHLPDSCNLAGLPAVVPDERRHVALRSAGTAVRLAELDAVFGDRLHPALRERIRHEVDRRVFSPYEARDDLWWLSPPTSNWNAVCNGGVATAALSLLDDVDRQARIVAKATGSLAAYLADFDPDGCTTEGIGYWNYGFGSYVRFAALLEARTDGAYSLLSPPVVAEIARFPLRFELSPGRFVPVSDAEEEEAIVDPFAACWIGDRFDLPTLVARGRRSFERVRGEATFALGDALRTFRAVRRTPADAPDWEAPRRTYCSGHDWWLARTASADPDALVAAAKGGDNGESHNHNDVGSFVCHYRGESLLTDLGAPVYDADYFGDNRYESLAARSLGHNVPYVNGTEQAAGEDHAATVVERRVGDEADAIAFDFAGAYPAAAGLDSLERTVALDRTDGGSVVVEDQGTFADADNEFVEVLVSYAPMTAVDAGLRVTGDRATATVTADPAPADVRVEHLADAVRGDDVWRARFSYQPDASLTCAMTIEPETDAVEPETNS